jgi:hypothetical protein
VDEGRAHGAEFDGVFDHRLLHTAGLPLEQTERNMCFRDTVSKFVSVSV